MYGSVCTRVRTKVRKELGGVSYSLVYSVPGIKEKEKSIEEV